MHVVQFLPIKLRAERKCGELDEKRKPLGRGKIVAPDDDLLTRQDRHHFRQLASLDEPEFNAVVEQVKASVDQPEPGKEIVRPADDLLLLDFRIG